MKRMTKWLAAMLLVVLFCTLPFATVSASSAEPAQEEVVAPDPYVPPEIAVDAPPAVGGQAYIVIDPSTGQVVISQNADVKKYPASITKVLTIALALESLDNWQERLSDSIEVSWNAAHSLMPGAAHISLTEGEVVSLGDMLYAAQIVSANDAANVLAEYTAGSMEEFAWRMTDKAKQLGATGSNFVNASGLPDLNHYTTAADMAKITGWALTVPGFRELFGAENYNMAATNKQPSAREFRAFNQMVSSKSKFHYNGLVGSKSGFTNDARHTLSTAAKRGDVELVCIVLQCDRGDMVYEDSWALLNYCFDNFSRVQYPAADILPNPVPVFAGGSESLGDITVEGGEDISFLLHNSLAVQDVNVRCQVPEKYVVGQPFTPTVSLALANECSMQLGQLVGAAPLSWSGVEELMAKNTAAPWERVAGSHPLEFWFLFSIVAIVALLLVWRVLYVRHRRSKRRNARLASARAQMSIRIAERPAQLQRSTMQRNEQNRRRAQTRPVQGRQSYAHAPQRNTNVLMYRKKNAEPAPEQQRRVGRVR